MEFVLVQNEVVSFADGCTHKPNSAAVRSAMVPVEIFRKSSGQQEYNKGYVTSIKNFLVQSFGRKRPRLENATATQPLPVFAWLVEVSVSHLPGKPSAVVNIISSKNSDHGCFAQVAEVCGGFENFTVTLDLELTKGRDVVKEEVKRLKLQPLKSSFKGTFSFNESFAQRWRVCGEIQGKLSIYLNLKSEALDNIHVAALEDPLSINKKMLRDSISTDATIIAGNGEKILCHKGFLSAHSPVFNAMFEKEMREGISNTVELPDMTESGVRALLAYCYCWETKKALESCSVALELLLASDKYNISTLQQRICEIMLSKSITWFTVPVAVQLLQFVRKKMDQLLEVRNYESFKKIEEKCAEVLKSKSTKELHECYEFQQLFTDPIAGMEFCSYFIVNK